jgi:hypothetical protein
MIEFTCQVKDLIERLETLAKVKLCVSKQYYDVNCRVTNSHCELCVNMKAHNNNHYKYSDYYAYMDVENCVGQGMFGIPHAFDLLPAFKTLDKTDFLTFKYDKDYSYVQILDLFYDEKSISLSTVFIDNIQDLLKFIPPTKDLKDTHFNSVVFNSHPLKSNCLLILRTDSMRLMYYDFSLETAWPFGCVIVPRDAIAWITKLKKQRDKNVIVKVHGDYISFEYGAYRMVCGITKEFPPVQGFIKSDVDCVLTVSTESFIKAVEYAAIGDVDNAVIIKAKNKEVIVYSCGNESRKRRVNCELNSDKEFELTIQSQFLTSILKMCGNNVSISSLHSLKDIYKITSPDKDFHYIVGYFKKSY